MSTLDLIGSGNDLHAALYQLRQRYAAIQEHHGFSPEQSDTVRMADAALKRWTSTISKVGQA